MQARIGAKFSARHACGQCLRRQMAAQQPIGPVMRHRNDEIDRRRIGAPQFTVRQQVGQRGRQDIARLLLGLQARSPQKAVIGTQ